MRRSTPETRRGCVWCGRPIGERVLPGVRQRPSEHAGVPFLQPDADLSRELVDPSAGPTRHRPFGDIDRRAPRISVSSSSSTREPDEGPDEYEMNSFVVPDDAEITYSLFSGI